MLMVIDRGEIPAHAVSDLRVDSSFCGLDKAVEHVQGLCRLDDCQRLPEHA